MNCFPHAFHLFQILYTVLEVCEESNTIMQLFLQEIGKMHSIHDGKFQSVRGQIKIHIYENQTPTPHPSV